MYELTANDHETSTFPNELVEDVKRIERCEDKQQILNDLVDKAVRRCRNGKQLGFPVEVKRQNFCLAKKGEGRKNNLLHPAAQHSRIVLGWLDQQEVNIQELSLVFMEFY